MVNSKYSLVEYSAEWPAQYIRYSKLIRDAFADNLVAIHHIGSTSVPGLAAKPIIDIMPIVRDITLVEGAKEQMIERGFNAWGEYGLPGRRYFTLDDDDGVRKVNCHTYQIDNSERIRHLAFPAYLRAHPEVCLAYVEVKRAAIAAHNANINAYNDHKDPWIKVHEPLAVAWYLEGNSAETSPNRE